MTRKRIWMTPRYRMLPLSAEIGAYQADPLEDRNKASDPSIDAHRTFDVRKRDE